MSEMKKYAETWWTVADLDQWDVTEQEAEAILDENQRDLLDVTISAGNLYLEAIMSRFSRIDDADEDIDDDDELDDDELAGNDFDDDDFCDGPGGLVHEPEVHAQVVCIPEAGATNPPSDDQDMDFLKEIMWVEL